MKRHVRSVVGVALLAWLGSCSDSLVGPCSPCDPPSLIVSDPVSAAGLLALTGAGLAVESRVEDSLVFVSLPPGAVPAGSRAQIRRVGGGVTLGVAVSNGGFDPLWVSARAGDSIAVVITTPDGDTVTTLGFDVKAGTAPIVVRTEPPPRKRDVPLNAVIVVVFSEPVDGSTLNTSSLRLFLGANAVVGTVRLLPGSITSAVFEPTTPLSPNTDYRLEVTRAVRDLTGNQLRSAATAVFTTGTAVAGAPGSLTLSPDSIRDLFAGASHDIAVAIRDAAGNTLTGQPLTWASSNPAVATVAPADSSGMSRGRVQGVSAGSATITATSGSLSATAFVTVTGAPSYRVASVTITPDPAMVAALDSFVLTVMLRDSSGRRLDNGTFPPPPPRFEITFSSSDTSLLSPPAAMTSGAECSSGNSDGSVTLCPWWSSVRLQPTAQGSVQLIATSDGVSDTALITVGPRRAVASVRVVPKHWTMVQPSTHRVWVHLADANGNEILGAYRSISWTLDKPAGATVDTVPGSCWMHPAQLPPYGPNVYACALDVSVRDTGTVTVTVTSEGVSDTVTIALPDFAFASVSAGGFPNTWGINSLEGHTCGITVGGRTLCWGGDGAYPGDEWSHFSAVPWAVPAPALTSLTASQGYSCGLSTSGDAYCWGSSIYLDPFYDYWELGLTDKLEPLGGGHRFVALDAGAVETCGLTTAGAVYCWDKRLGPVAVSTPHAFTSLSVGVHRCALTSNGAAFCWGNNSHGQLGDGSNASSPVPVAVGGGLSFVSLSAGTAHTCGLTAAGSVHCWGRNASGELGDGTTSARALPSQVSGGLTFTALSSGSRADGSIAATTCGLTAAGAAYCWGDNEWGQVGDATTVNRLAPTPVAGGLQFASVSIGERHSCAVTTAAVAYCWGWNGAGQLGNDGVARGSLGHSFVPVKVAGQP